MTTQGTAQRQVTSRAGVAPFIVLAIAALAFVAGLGLARLTPASTPAQVAAAEAAPTFDSVGFRAGERDSWAPAPTFDAARFRAEERQP